jgi:hypothetical protein
LIIFPNIPLNIRFAIHIRPKKSQVVGDLTYK